MTDEQLFWDLFKSPIESDVEKVLKKHNLLQSPSNWKPYGGIDSNFGVVDNQQSSPIPALIEKITNGIDAILMRLCREQGIDPRSENAPRSIEEALERFYPDHKNWDIGRARRKQAESLQILADGPRKDTSLIVFDEGEGQLPEEFEKTFLSLLQGNKNDIHFVQGKYNMGGAGAVVFCGKRRYQLICSRRFDNPESVGFTLVRRHPLTAEENRTKKSTWYEYLILDGRIPSFTAGELDLGLYNRKFNFGTVIKLYSYDLPAGSRSVISRDLNRSINEYLFNPALPVFTIDSPKRFPKDYALQRELYGLKRRLEEDGSKYIDTYFSEEITDDEIGRLRVTCYVFKPRVDERSVKDTQGTIQKEFFKNNMSVLFSVNGQVHGHYTSEFITRSLKFSLLKNSLLIAVDCTNVQTEFRNELFMASRDRLKEGEESRRLRNKLTEILSKGRLNDIHKARKASITVESNDAEKLVRELADNLPIQKELAALLDQTFNIEKKDRGNSDNKTKNSKSKENTHEKPSFSPKKYPTFFKIEVESKKGEEYPMVGLSISGERTIRFSTDVEDHYFDRVDDPGEFQLALLGLSSNEKDNPSPNPIPNKPDTFLNVAKSSPQDGTIRVQMKPTKELKVGDVVKLQASLSSPDKDLSQVFHVKITDPEKKQNERDEKNEPERKLGLPKLIMVYKDKKPNGATWEQLEGEGIPMDHDVVVYPFVEADDKLSRIYINMDSKALLSYRSKLAKSASIDVANKRYVSAVYFHTLFLYTITKNRKYGIVQQDSRKNDEPVDMSSYISDIFGSFYAQFLLNFDTQELIESLEM